VTVTRAGHAAVGGTHDEMVAPRLLQHVRHQFRRDRCTTLVLFVLSRVREQRNDSGNSLRARDLAGVDHDAQFHQGRIHFPASRVDDVHVVLAHRLSDANVRLPNATPRQLCVRDLYAQPGEQSVNRANGVNVIESFWLPSADDLCQLWMARPFGRGKTTISIQ
jgi:hypothetical protein